MKPDMDALLYRRAMVLGYLAIAGLVILIGGMLAGLLLRHGALYIAIGFLLSVALRQAALMTFVLISPWRDARWRRRYIQKI